MNTLLVTLVKGTVQQVKSAPLHTAQTTLWLQSHLILLSHINKKSSKITVFLCFLTSVKNAALKAAPKSFVPKLKQDRCSSSGRIWGTGLRLVWPNPLLARRDAPAVGRFPPLKLSSEEEKKRNTHKKRETRSVPAEETIEAAGPLSE